MEEKILNELLKRPGMSEQDWELLKDMIHDSIIDMRSCLNYEDEESLPEGVIPAVKELTLIRFNKTELRELQANRKASAEVRHIWTLCRIR